MRTKKAVFYLLALMLGGCIIPSLHPLYTDDTLIFEEKLVGKWVEDDGNIWVFRDAGEQGYEMTIINGEHIEGQFIVHLVELGDMLFLDLFPDDPHLEQGDFYMCHLLPVHTFMKVDQIDPNLQLRMMDPDSVSEMLEEDPNLLKHEVRDDGIVLTASTKQLQEFVIEYANEEGVFGDPEEFTRRIPLYKDEDLVFDTNLIGEWEGKDGEILDSIQIAEKAYDMLFIDANDNEYQFFANLVKLEGLTFLAVFFDKSSVEEKDSYGLHLIPDCFALVKQIEPELRVQQMDYEEVREVLQNGPDSLKQETAEADNVFKRVLVEP
jgi:hypothetical protein